MSSFTDTFGNILTGANNLVGNNQNINNSDFEKDGFIVPSIPGADGNGLPSSKVPSNRVNAQRVRKIIHWFVPEIGIVKMYVNPASIDYGFEKIISQERTKGGYVLQYWGETLPVLRIAGSTGSSGIEGINVLYEIYRSEQLTFDSIGLTIASNNTVSGVGDLVAQGIGSLGLGNAVGQATAGLFDLNPVSQSLLPKNIPSLASLAFGIELFYSGWVFRGYFKSFNFSERADNTGMFTYNMEFIVTQRRGYRFNSMPWQHSAIDGPSDHDTIPYTFQGGKTK